MIFSTIAEAFFTFCALVNKRFGLSSSRSIDCQIRTEIHLLIYVRQILFHMMDITAMDSQGGFFLAVFIAFSGQKTWHSIRMVFPCVLDPIGVCCEFLHRAGKLQINTKTVLNIELSKQRNSKIDSFHTLMHSSQGIAFMTVERDHEINRVSLLTRYCVRGIDRRILSIDPFQNSPLQPHYKRN